MSADEPNPGVSAEALQHYCRDVEAYLCRKNDGHLIRVVGPAFEMVKGWADRGVPLAIVREAIDQVVARAARKPQVRRRPLRIEFCEGDVLAGFDRWRRAVGVTLPGEVSGGATAASGAARRGSLQAHVDNVAITLAAVRDSDRRPAALGPALETAIDAVDALRQASATARGAAREAVLATLADIDNGLIEAASAALPSERLATLTAEAADELAQFRSRLAPEDWETAVAAARCRLVRVDVGLPTVRFD